MTNRLHPDPQDEERRFQPAEGRAPASHDFYAELCMLENLQPAYAYLKENSRELDIDPSIFQAIEAEGVQSFLRQLSDDLQTRTYQPTATNVAESGDVTALRDRLVQVALKLLLESAFSLAFSRDPDAEKTIKWLAANIDKGLSRVYALNLNESNNDGGCERLVERVSRRIADPQLIGLLKDILAASPPEQVTTLLADIACEDIDHILQQAKTLGREDNFLHVQCTRVGNELVVLLDGDPRYDWILPAVHKRLREELSNLHYEPASIESQTLDLTCGHRLRFLDYEFRLIRNWHGEARVRYRLVAKSKRRQAKKMAARRRLSGRDQSSRLLQPCLTWLDRWRSWRFVYGLYRKCNTIQVGWRHLPITLLPVLMMLFGWRSIVSLLCLAAIPVCNWRWLVHAALATYDKVNSIQASWRHLPITLLPILLLLLGWRSPLTWLDVAAIFICNGCWSWGLSLVCWTRRHKVDVAMIACALTALICLSPLLRDIYANRPHEVAVSSSLPPGFYLGEYHDPSWWSSETTPTIEYGLYLPPHLQGQKGPFPLIVFLHGYGERAKTHIFTAGLPRAIIQRIGPQGDKRPLKFAAFFPLDPTGQWQVGSAETEGAMRALDYVIRHHHIDPARIYLTGHSSGGSGVWALTQAYPHKWAAVAPVCSFISPDVQKVRHIPAWIFHGDKDELAPVERDRILVQQLKEAEADVRYTEFPNKGHLIWPEAYDPDAFYIWLANKKKD